MKYTTAKFYFVEEHLVYQPMYTKYFGFNEKPFTLTPNPRFIFLSKNHKEAFAHLLYGINNHYGFIELTGEVGTGKTTVLRTLMGQLQDENYRTALIFSPCLTGVELLRSINTEFGINCTSEYSNELLADLNRFLLEESSEGRTVVLVIDEAQNLQPDVLEQIRLISNLETENDKLIQIILAGQPELEILLGRSDLRQLNQRIAVRYKLCSMSMYETRSYIRQRMEVAGETGGVSFSNYSIKLIYFATRGVPRLINILCDRVLLIAYGDECRRITAGTVIRGIREVLNRSLLWKLVFMIVGIIISSFAATYLVATYIGHLPQFSNSSSTQPTFVVSSGSTQTNPKTVPTPNTVMLEQEILSANQNDIHKQVFNTFASLWRVRPLKIIHEKLKIPETFKRLAAKRKMQVTLVNGSLDDLFRFDLPFIAVTKLNGDFGAYCYAVVSVSNEQLSVSPPLFNRKTISKDVFSAVTSGTYYLVWQNYGQIPVILTKGEKRFEIRTLQSLLKQAGFYRDVINGIYTAATITAVNQFQHSLGIARNDSLGELTLAALTRFDTTHKIPSLTQENKKNMATNFISVQNPQRRISSVQ
ncbi:MAG: AAA family ATPase [Geobacteraceae bacterium]|nr:AAA family ATPase [Geobacteraceae bacterium]